MRNPLDVVIVCQGVFGLAFLAVGGMLYRAKAQLRAYGGRTTGTIVALRARDRLSEASWAVHAWAADVATIRFRTQAGDEIVARSELRGHEAPARPGDRVRILYDPTDPQRMRIDTSLGRGVLTAVWLLAIGTVVEVVAVATAALALTATASAATSTAAITRPAIGSPVASEITALVRPATPARPLPLGPGPVVISWIAGTLKLCGGPAPGGCQVENYTVCGPRGCIHADRARISGDGSSPVTFRVRRGRFKVTVNPGRYRVVLLGDGRHVHGKVLQRKTVVAKKYATAHVTFTIAVP